MRRLVLAAGFVVACGGAQPIDDYGPGDPVAPAPMDFDGDGLTTTDVCPCVAEDFDLHDDGDGCPDLDDDRDGVPDACDSCLAEPETMNEFEDTDGCPDVPRVIISESRITILEPIRFTRNSAEIEGRSEELVAYIADILIENPQILRVLVRGHAASDERRRDALSLARAEAVRDALVARGVAAERLVVEGVGTTLPMAEHPDWQRTVDYQILEIAPPPPPPPPPPEPAPCPDYPRACDEGPFEAPGASAAVTP